MKSIVVHAVSLAALSFATAAMAQTSEQSAGTRPAAEEEVGLGDIVVTARRRAESMQSVPVSVTALTPEVLRKQTISSPFDLLSTTPSLTVMAGSASRNDPNYFIRGQGQTSQAEASVVLYFAEVPQITFGESVGSNIQFFDLDNIQVLKGPQGTLFGRSNTGGAVLFTPKRPGNEFDGFAEMTLGNYNHKELTAAVNVPLIDNVLAIRVAANLVKRDGFAKSINNGQELDDRNRQSFRIGALFTPTDWLSNYLLYQDNNADENGTALIAYRVNPDLPLLNTTATGAGRATVNFICGLIQGGQPCIDQRIARLDTIRNDLINEKARIDAGGNVRRTLNGPERMFIRSRLQQVINNTEIKIPVDGLFTDLTLKNIFSTYRIAKAGQRKELAFSSQSQAGVIAYSDYINYQQVAGAKGTTKWFDQYSEEFQVQTQLANKHDIILGYFYERNNRNQFGNAPVLFGAYGGAFSVPFGAYGLSASYSTDYLKAQRGLFASGTFDLAEVGLDGVKFTAGYRRSKVTNRARVIRALITPGGLTPDPTDAGLFGLDIEKANSYTFSLDWKVTPDVLLYAATRRGFKQGGINIQSIEFPNAAGSIPYYKPEIVTDVELGMKADWNAGGIYGRTNIALFNSKFSNVQRANTVPNTAGGVISQIANIAKSRVRGIELENTIQVTPQFRVGLNYGYLDAKYLSYPGTLINSAGQVRNLIDSPYTAAPKHKLNLNANYVVIQDSDIGKVSGTADFTYQSSVAYSDTALEDPISQNTTVGGLLNLRVDWENVKGQPLDLALFVRNVTNKDYLIGLAGLYASLGTVAKIYGDPRVIGVQARIRFGASAD